MIHDEVGTKTHVSFIERVKLWAKIPGTAQHETLTRKSLKCTLAQNVICYTKGPAFNAALLINGDFASIKNKIQGLDITVAVATLRSKLEETTTWVDARWIVLTINNVEIRIKKTSLTAALQRFE